MAAPTDFTFEIIPDSERLPDDSLNLARFQQPAVDLPYELLGELGAKMAALDAAMTSLLDSDGGSVHLMLQVMGRAVGERLTGHTLTVHELLATYGTVPRINEKFEFIVARNVARLVGIESLNYKSLARREGWVMTLLQEIYLAIALPGLDDRAHRARKCTDVFKPNPDNGADLIAVYYDGKTHRIACGLYQVKDMAKLQAGLIKTAYKRLKSVRAEIEAQIDAWEPYVRNAQVLGKVQFGYALIASGEVDRAEIAACADLSYTDINSFADSTFTPAEAAVYKKVRGPKVE